MLKQGMWVLLNVVVLQIWKHHRKASVKGIPSRTKTHMCGRTA